MKQAALLILLVLLGTSAVLYLSDDGRKFVMDLVELDSPFVEACEAAIQERLRSPSSYQRVEIVESAKPMSKQQYIEHKEEHGESFSNLDKLVIERDNIIKHQAIVAYDTKNTFGSLLRGIATCEYISPLGTSSKISHRLALHDPQVAAVAMRAR